MFLLGFYQYDIVLGSATLVLIFTCYFPWWNGSLLLIQFVNNTCRILIYPHRAAIFISLGNNDKKYLLIRLVDNKNLPPLIAVSIYYISQRVCSIFKEVLYSSFWSHSLLEYRYMYCIKAYVITSFDSFVKFRNTILLSSVSFVAVNYTSPLTMF